MKQVNVEFCSAACHQKTLNCPGLVETTPAVLYDSCVTKTGRVYMETVFKEAVISRKTLKWGDITAARVNISK